MLYGVEFDQELLNIAAEHRGLRETYRVLLK